MEKSLYQHLMSIKNDKEGINCFYTYMKTLEEIENVLTPNEVKNLLFDEVYENYFVQYFIDNIRKLMLIFPIEEIFEILNKKDCKYLDEEYISTVLETLGAQKFINLVNNMPDNERKKKYLSYFQSEKNMISIINSNYTLYRMDFQKFEEICHGKFLYGLSTDLDSRECMNIVCNIESISSNEIFKKNMAFFKDDLMKFYSEIFNRKDFCESLPESINTILYKIYDYQVYFSLIEFFYKYPNKAQSMNLEIDREFLLSHLFNYSTNLLSTDKELYCSYSLILDDLLRLSNCRIEDIEYSGSGNFSNAFKIGDFVLKTGDKERVTKIIPNHPLILQPLLRRSVDNNTFIEVSQYVEPLEESEEAEEIVYQIFKQLRDDGIDWRDPNVGNVGKLLHDNVAYANKEKIYISPESVGLKEKNRTILKAGNYVVLDTDFIYNIGETTCYSEGYMYRYYLTRYKKEKGKKI